MTLENRLTHWVQRHRLWAPGTRVGVAVSGGSDSVALLRLLHPLAEPSGLQLSVVHFDHGWREGSAADAEFVAGLAANLQLPLHAVRAGEQPEADLEQAARRQRYGYFQSLLTAGQMDRIATAHTLDDQAETVLLRLLRGTGTAGLAGVLPARRLEPGGAGMLVRPLLWARRAELRSWLESLEQTWREDPTNHHLDRRRNWVRHELLPLMLHANPSLPVRFGALAEIVRAEEAYWSEHVELMSQRVWTPTATGLQAEAAALAGLPLALQRRLIRDGVGRLQGDLRRVEFGAVEAVVEALASPATHPRQFTCGRVVCRLQGRHLELGPAPAI